MRRDDLETEGPSPDRWLLSYADFITLLLATFVVLYAMTSVDTEQLRGILVGVRTAFTPVGNRGGGVLDGLPTAGSARMSRGTITGEGETGANFEFLLLRERVANAIRDGAEAAAPGAALHARVRSSERGLVISLAASQVFSAGGIAIAPGAQRAIDAIATVLRTTSQPIRVEGHTDDRPIRSDRFPSNWELSTARATVVVRQLVEKHGIEPSRVSAAGYAQHRPLVPNDSEDNRALNRRIDIVILRPDAARSEPRAEGEEASLKRLLERLPPVE